MIYIILACVIFIACVIWLRASTSNVAQALLRVSKIADRELDDIRKRLDKIEHEYFSSNKMSSNFDENNIDSSLQKESEHKSHKLDLEDKPIDHKKKTILHIDDDQFLLDFCGSALRKSGYNVFLREVFKKDFVSEIHSLKPDLILCDVVRPYPDGFQIIRAVKADDRTKNIPFVFYSNSIDPDVSKISDELGGFEPILKAGTTMSDLSTKIRDILATKNGSEK